MKKFFIATWNMLKSNLWLKIVAFLFAFIIWSYVMAGTNPMRTKTLENVGLTITNASELQAKGLIIDDVLTDMIDSVTVTVEAGVDSHKNITENTVKATVDLASINEAGTVELSIVGSTTVSGATIKSVSPSTIELKIDDLVTRQVPVTCITTGEPQSGYYISTPEMASDHVLIRGAKTNIEQVASAVCYIPVEELTANVRKSYEVSLYSEDGEDVTENVVVDSIPSVIVDIEVLPTKMVSIDEQSLIDSITNVKEGYEITGVVIEPATLTIAATQDVLNAIANVRLQAISVDGADRSVIVDVPVQSLEDVVYISDSVVEVLVQISEIQAEKVFKNQRIEMDSLAEGYTARITTDAYSDVTVTGGRTVVSEIKASDLRLFVDLQGLEEGTHICKVETEAIDGILSNGIALEVSQVTVEIRKD